MKMKGKLYIYFKISRKNCHSFFFLNSTNENRKSAKSQNVNFLKCTLRKIVEVKVTKLLILRVARSTLSQA